MHFIEEYLIEHKDKINKDKYVQGLALGFWQAYYVFLQYQYQGLLSNTFSTNAYVFILKTINQKTIKVIEDLDHLNPCNETSEHFKKLLLTSYKHLFNMTQ